MMVHDAITEYGVVKPDPGWFLFSKPVQVVLYGLGSVFEQALYRFCRACKSKVLMRLGLTAEYLADDHLFGMSIRFWILPADKLFGHAHEITVICFALLAN